MPDQEIQTRVQLTSDDAWAVAAEAPARLSDHLEKVGAGVFVHPHETVGCLLGQLNKLSAAADESIYSGDTSKFEERLWKTALPVLFAIASVRKLRDKTKTAIPN